MSRLPMVICFVYSVWVLLKKHNQIQKTSYAQHPWVCQTWKKMEIMTQEVQTNVLKEVVSELLADSIGKDIEKP